MAVVSSVLSGNGKRPVYWVPPPTARDPEFNNIFATQNRAVKRATESMPTLRYVDVYSTLNGGHYSDSLKVDGRRVLARQPDGIHFTRDGAVRARAPYPRRHGRGLPRPAGPMKRGLAALAACLALAPASAGDGDGRGAQPARERRLAG